MLITFRPRDRRRGIILIVVLAMLTLFAIVGLSFVLVANAQEASARIAREGESLRGGMSPEVALSLALGQLLYDVEDNTLITHADINPMVAAQVTAERRAAALSGIGSGLRGHSLGRGLYGWNDASVAPTFLPIMQDAAVNDRPFVGTGRLNYVESRLADASKPNVVAGGATYSWNTNAWLVNYTYFPSDGILRDPEYLLPMNQVIAAPTDFRPTSRVGPGSPTGRGLYTGGQNVGYTYPDHQNYFLGEINPVTGELAIGSFHREYIFGRLDYLNFPANVNNPNAGENANWTNKLGRYMTVRPRPIDNLSQAALTSAGLFPLPPLDTLTGGQRTTLINLIRTEQQAGRLIPYPEDRNGDVKNLDHAPGGNDSVWIDLNAPIMTLPDGRRCKALVAPLLLSLDGRLNLNVAGNLMGYSRNTQPNPLPPTQHRSLQGWGPWEMNPMHILNVTNSAANNTPTEWRRILLGSDDLTAPPGAGPLARIRGRYDNNNNLRIPGPGLPDPSGPNRNRLWSLCDVNGMRDSPVPANPPHRGDLSNGFNYPAAGSAAAWHPFVQFTPEVFGNGVTEQVDHPLKYNVMQSQSPNATGPNRLLPIAGLPQLLRFGGTGYEALPSDLMRLLPNNLLTSPGDNQATALAKARRRNQLTLLSMDLDRSSVLPYIWNQDGDDTPSPPGPPPPPTMPPNPANYAQTRYGNTTGLPANRGSIPYPSLLRRTTGGTATPAPANSDFSSSWSAHGLTPLAVAPHVLPNTEPPRTVITPQKLNLTRRHNDPTRPPLPAYPVPHTAATGAATVVGLLWDESVRTGPAGPAQAAEQARYDAAIAAVQARQAMAMEILDQLVQVTGGKRLLLTGTTTDVATYSAEFNALRPLAQIAVNMVDYIDNDDYITPFNWATNVNVPGPGTTPHFVFGTEMPRLLINESFVQYNNTPADEMAGTAGPNYNCSVWAELINPTPVDPAYNAGEDSIARLSINGNPVYRIQLTQQPASGTIQSGGNPTGDAGALALATHSAWGTRTEVLPFAAGSRFQPNDMNMQTGFYVVGPTPAGVTAASNPGFTTTTTSGAMYFPVPVGANDDTIYSDGTYRPTILLQRLANPAIPLNTTIGSPVYNPFVTTDYVERTMLPGINAGDPITAQFHDARMFNGTGADPKTTVTTNMTYQWTNASWGRMQPFDGGNTAGATAVSRRLKQQPGAAPGNTFFRQNSTAATEAALTGSPAAGMAGTDATLKVPFDWLVHLDRLPVNPMELWHVSGFKPGRLTEQFVTGDVGVTKDNQHTVAWTAQSTRLYRFFEVANNEPLFNGLRSGGRVPGKINLNGMWTDEMLMAMSDPEQVEYEYINPSGPYQLRMKQGGNKFTRAQVTGLTSALVTQRTPVPDATYPPQLLGRPLPLIGPTDPGLLPLNGMSAAMLNRPFKPLSTGYYQPDPSPAAQFDDLSGGPRGIADTLLRASPADGTRLTFDVGLATDPSYRQKELLTKIYGNLTTRSNVFAVWMTIGFFEVSTDGKLMGELGRAENRHVRHRGFALVDRTQMQMWPTFVPDTNDTIPTLYVPNRFLNPAVGLNLDTHPTTPVPNPLAADNPQPIQVTFDIPFTDAPAGRQLLTNPTQPISTTNLRVPANPNNQYRHWAPADGLTITVDPNTDREESVVLSNVQTYPASPMMPDRYRMTATFRKTHGRNAANALVPVTIIARGNPGPAERFDPRKDAAVVPYFGIID